MSDTLVEKTIAAYKHLAGHHDQKTHGVVSRGPTKDTPSSTGNKLQKKLDALSDKELQKVNLSKANLSAINLSGRNLSNINLYKATLKKASLKGSNLIGADLRNANLQGADLSGANLQGAELDGIDLRGTDLRGADLSSAGLIGAKLDGIVVDKKTKIDELAFGTDFVQIDYLKRKLGASPSTAKNLGGKSLFHPNNSHYWSSGNVKKLSEEEKIFGENAIRSAFPKDPQSAKIAADAYISKLGSKATARNALSLYYGARLREPEEHLEYRKQGSLALAFADAAFRLAVKEGIVKGTKK